MKIIKFIIPLAILNLIALILVTLGLPEVVPIHMNLAGEIDGYGSRWFIPIVGMVTAIVAIICKSYIPLTKSDLNIEIGDKIISAVTIFLIAISWIPVFLAMTSVNLSLISSQNSPHIDMISYVGIIMGILFVFIGFNMKKIKPNWIIGIRTPWTLKNKIVWEKTHKLGSHTSMIGGFVLLFCSIATYLIGNSTYFLIGLGIFLFFAAIIPTIYSYYEYKKLN
jgi:uncharacterized membrane protein